MEQFHVVLTQIGIFLILIILGIIVTKLKILDEHSLHGVSKFVVNVSLPAFVFTNAVETITKERLMDSLFVIPLEILIYALMFVTIFILEKVFRLKGNRQRVYRASFLFGNLGFMGIPLLAVIYPETGILYVSIFTVVDMVILWTYGVTLTWPVTEEKKPFSLKGLKNLISAPVIAMILSAVFVICGWKLPGVLSSTLSSVGSTSMPLALIYIGGALYGSDFRSMLKRPELYAGIAVKMAALPLAVFVILRAIGSGSEIAGMFAIAVSLPGIELIPMMAKANGSNGEYALGAIMLSTIASLATIPLVSLGISLLQ
ncbi:MAG: AEC family transporter [Lachnospiraceae bacterium]|nr:AEC family transporter [Lachnospiraceae bacterium]